MCVTEQNYHFIAAQQANKQELTEVLILSKITRK
jgi:hypothetical protein